MRLLRVPRDERASFRRKLKALVAAGELLQIRGNRYGLPEKMDLVVGRLSTNPAGFGFVVPEQSDHGDAKGPAPAPARGGRGPTRDRPQRRAGDGPPIYN